MAIDSLIIMCQRYIISWEMVVSKAASFRYQKKIAQHSRVQEHLQHLQRWDPPMKSWTKEVSK